MTNRWRLRHSCSVSARLGISRRLPATLPLTNYLRFPFSILHTPTCDTPMDPFSLTVGAITLAGAAKNAIGGISHLITALRDAPEELQDLQAGLSQFEEILRVIQDTTRLSENAGSSLEPLIGRAKDKIVELDSLIEYTLTQAGSSHKVDRYQWKQSQKDVDKLRKQMNDIRADLDIIFGVRTTYVAPIPKFSYSFQGLNHTNCLFPKKRLGATNLRNCPAGPLGESRNATDGCMFTPSTGGSPIYWFGGL